MRIHNEYGYINTLLLKEKCSLDINTSYYLHKYGGIVSISKELNLNYRQGSRPDPEDIKNDFYNVYLKCGRIDLELYLEYGHYSKQAIDTAFGGLNNLMKQLGIELNMSRMENKETVSNDIISIIKRYNTTSSNVYRKHGKYSESVITRLFGSWENAMNELGFKCIRKIYGYDYIFNAVKSVFNKYGFISREIIDDECEFTYQAVRFYFKNKDELSKALGVENAFCDSRSAKALVIDKILKEKFEIVETEYYWDWLRNDKTNKIMYVDFYIP